MLRTVFPLAPSLLILTTLSMSAPTDPSRIKKSSFGSAAEGKPVDLYVLTSKKGVEAAITNYGGTVVWLKTPDRNGHSGDIVLGFDDFKGYLQKEPYFGALVGRYANRIAKGRFSLDGKEYKLAINNGANALHGGEKGFDKQVWDAKPVSNMSGDSLELTY